jgi:hypothetical protein
VGRASAVDRRGDGAVRRVDPADGAGVRARAHRVDEHDRVVALPGVEQADRLARQLARLDAVGKVALAQTAGDEHPDGVVPAEVVPDADDEHAPPGGVTHGRP